MISGRTWALIIAIHMLGSRRTRQTEDIPFSIFGQTPAITMTQSYTLFPRSHLAVFELAPAASYFPPATRLRLLGIFVCLRHIESMACFSNDGQTSVWFRSQYPDTQLTRRHIQPRLQSAHHHDARKDPLLTLAPTENEMSCSTTSVEPPNSPDASGL